MEKSCHSSGDSTSNNNSSSNSNSNYQQHHHQNNSSSSSNSRDQYLKQLNRFSHKISKDSKPPPIGKYPLDLHHHHQQQQQSQQQQQQQQPPVYNINKNDFRDVVQKLTGSPAHERNFSTPPPIHPPKPQSSRLQRIRPPPLAHLSPRPPPPLANTILPPTTSTTATTAVAAGGATNVATFANNAVNINSAGNFVGNNNGRPVTPLSPLPPFPAVHAAAESPISAYMRYLQSSMSTVDSDSKRFSSGLSPLVSPRWNNPNSLQPQVSPRWNNNNNNNNAGPLQPPPPQPQLQSQLQQQILFPSSTAAMSPSQFLMPSSPLPFGKLPSPRSPYPLLSPTFLFSPTSGQLGFPQFPPSPRLPLSSPRWRDL
ncbi:VQ motif-containing protein 9-like [Telopea speciosissima]|uniref:VQ motif-containing protein 9-like n=1 Tax=Telopea speciosissima TaxID=54955 RepID=UPI001CC4161C|nr:VQ motif-containing protein 9-like [Telopea speciosissima]